MEKKDAKAAHRGSFTKFDCNGKWLGTKFDPNISLARTRGIICNELNGIEVLDLDRLKIYCDFHGDLGIIGNSAGVIEYCQTGCSELKIFNEDSSFQDKIKFFDFWFRYDNFIISYDKIDFLPFPAKNPGNCYNTFKPFVIPQTTNKNYL